MPETLWQEWYAALPVGRITGTALRRLILEGNLIRPIQGSGDLPEFVGIDRELMETVVQRSREAVERTLEYYKKVDAAQLFSIELHAAPIFSVLRIDMSRLEQLPQMSREQVVDLLYDSHVATGSHVLLQPHEVYRTFSLEWLNLPPGCAGEISPRTSIGRQGIQVTLLPAVDPGVSGCISLQLINHNRDALPLILEQPCCKLALHKLPGTDALAYQGPYNRNMSGLPKPDSIGELGGILSGDEALQQAIRRLSVAGSLSEQTVQVMIENERLKDQVRRLEEARQERSARTTRLMQIVGWVIAPLIAAALGYLAKALLP